MSKILVTGGAGFIGSHLVDSLIQLGHHVRVLDNLEPQVHGNLRERGQKPDYLNPEAEFILGDIRDRDDVLRALEGIDIVFHEAALVGVGQSMYEISRYTDTNVNGTANLLQVIVDAKHRPRKMIVASSMSIYGEGTYECPVHGRVYPNIRETSQLAAQDWEMYCPIQGCFKHVSPLPTDENKPLHPTSIYAINKRDQEEMFLSTGRAYNIPAIALRYFNVYGPRQALSNPYTGVAAIFASRLLNGNPPMIFEDGLQSRDFVHVSDIVRANLLVMERDEADYGVFNVGTGKPMTVLALAEIIIVNYVTRTIDTVSMGVHQSIYRPEIVQKFRAGDIRHCFPDISKMVSLGFTPTLKFKDAVPEFLSWIVQQSAIDSFDEARRELIKRGLTV